MKVFATATVLSVSLGVWGCAPTPYQRAGAKSRHGYSDTRLSPDTFHVSFTANFITFPDTLREYLQRRAAELTLRYGFRYFAVIRKPRPLAQYKIVYPSEEDKEARVDGREVETPVWGTQHMTIQCFKTRDEASGRDLVDAQAYLREHPEPEAG